ncbi:alanine dehydrogenase [Paraburkholderia sp. UYCP14C]|uniref:alanine dehydrogenase n=1 Tax=Paraburkholderia sp. UYCP14C TaxID=2511130 RepID=UPI0010228E74|nr:alanine dehydrogenase [Paraburkholderia sp. UYCP14C]RZF25648.1 alanine dehydrogenase [Paraburkholderia sp. UYCP14C]
MQIGVPREIKNQEYRVGLTPASARELARRGHQVLIQKQAGAAVGLSDEAYMAAGATVCGDASEVWSRAGMIIKVKEPQAAERAMLRPGQILYAYLHLAPDRDQAMALIASGAVCIAYETITGPAGGLPLLAPMSEVAGRMSIQVAAASLEKPHGGMGLLLAGVPGVAPGHVAILGAGVVGTHALQMAVGIGARVTILDTNVERLRQLDLIFGNRITTLSSSAHAIEKTVLSADAVIGAVLIPGAAAPRLVTREMIAAMKNGAVVVDVAIDQGGCFETSRATTHAQPTYVVDGVVHYCVANMPGAVPRTSTFALTNATLGHAITLAEKGWKRAMADDAHLRAGLNICEGRVTYEAVAHALGEPYVPAHDLLG